MSEIRDKAQDKLGKLMENYRLGRLMYDKDLQVAEQILAIPELAHLLALAERAEEQGLEVVVVDREAKPPFVPYPDPSNWDATRDGYRQVQLRMRKAGWGKIVEG